MQRRVLVQLSLKRSAVEVQATRSLGDVARAFAQDSLNVLPFDAVERWDFVGWLSLIRDAAWLVKGRQDLVGVCGFGEVVDCAVSHGFEG